MILQSGCCKPPRGCGFKMINATFWEVPKGGMKNDDGDCNIWKNQEEKLCYDCNSCKGGVLANIRYQWKRLAILNVCALLLVTLIYAMGCCAVGNNRSDSHRNNWYYNNRKGNP